MNANKFLIPVWIIALSLAVLTIAAIVQTATGFPVARANSVPAIDIPLGEIAKNSLPNLPLSGIDFPNQFHDFGIIPDNKKGYTAFTFTNTGKEPLLILGAEGSCGCTVPTWPKEPIAPGKSGKIEVAFDPAGKLGEHSKVVSITSNTQPTTTILTIKATIIKSE